MHLAHVLLVSVDEVYEYHFVSLKFLDIHVFLYIEVVLHKVNITWSREQEIIISIIKTIKQEVKSQIKDELKMAK